MHAVSVSGGRATVGAGARLGDLYDALQQHEVTIPAGCGPTVGIDGLTAEEDDHIPRRERLP
jgi:FAD/FMN-containing dehydrogenase